MELRAVFCVLAATAAASLAVPFEAVMDTPSPADIMESMVPVDTMTPQMDMTTAAMPEKKKKKPEATMEATTEATMEATMAAKAGRGLYFPEPPPTAMEALRSAYMECVARGSFSCVKPRFFAFLSAAAERGDAIPITRDLVLERTAPRSTEESWESNDVDGASAEHVLERVDAFLRAHALRVSLPRELRDGPLTALVPPALLSSVPTELRLPLATSPQPAGQERGFLKKIIFPFLLGLKFKATAVVPVLLALIAVKTWKALTLALLSLVLSAALVIFKFTKPKVVNYEVIHYPHAPPPAVIEHPVATPYDHHYARAGPVDPHQMAYGAYAPQ